MKAIWGIDLGGTKIEGVVLESRQNPIVLSRIRIPTEREKGYEHILNQIQLLLSKLSAETGLKPEKLGICTPGTLDPITGRMKNCNTTCLNDQALDKDLIGKLGIPVILMNDANCFAMAEAQMGIVPDIMPEAKIVFGVIMGTGLGGGIVVNGQVLNGRQGIGGEWGHMFLDESGGPCYCGMRGCVETVISGPFLEKYYSSFSGITRSLPEIIDRHQNASDEAATNTVERLLHFFGKGIAQVINVLDPDVIVLGGGLGNIDLLYTQGVEEVKKHVFNLRLDTIFLKPKLGDSAGVFGAALLE
ncbi:MAG: ROK family protein [Microscillaceae bacterium]|nr:ROK family protein [Microscillaceae bacterium]